MIVETEAYDATTPPATPTAAARRATSSSSARRARAYVYLSYGIHRLLNFVCEPEGSARRRADPGARADRRNRADAPAPRAASPRTLLLGAGQADRGARHRARARTAPSLLRGAVRDLAPRRRLARPGVETDARIGITKATELPWRYCAAESRFSLGRRPAPRAGLRALEPGADAAATAARGGRGSRVSRCCRRRPRHRRSRRSRCSRGRAAGVGGHVAADAGR